MAKVNKTALHDFVTGEFVKEEHLDQNFEVLRVAINHTDERVDQLQHGLTSTGADIQALQAEVAKKVDPQYVDQKISDVQVQVNYLKNNKADIQYVEQLVSNVQAGQLVPGTIRTEHIADKSITAAKVDGVTVLTAQQVNQLITWDNLQGKPSQYPDAERLGGQLPEAYARVNVVNTFTAQQKFDAGIMDGSSNTDVSFIHSVQHHVHTRTVVLTYDSNGRLQKVEEKDGSTVVKTTTLTYDSSGRLSSVTESAGGVSITSTLNYDGSGNLISVTRV